MEQRCFPFETYAPRSACPVRKECPWNKSCRQCLELERDSQSCRLQKEYSRSLLGIAFSEQEAKERFSGRTTNKASLLTSGGFCFPRRGLNIFAVNAENAVVSVLADESAGDEVGLTNEICNQKEKPDRHRGQTENPTVQCGRKHNHDAVGHGQSFLLIVRVT